MLVNILHAHCENKPDNVRVVKLLTYILLYEMFLTFTRENEHYEDVFHVVVSFTCLLIVCFSAPCCCKTSLLTTKILREVCLGKTKFVL